MRPSLNTLILAGAVLGICAGLLLGHAGLPADVTAPWLAVCGFLGKTFISILKLIVVPLILTSIVAGIVNLQGSNRIHRLWPTLIAYAVLTTGLAAATGLLAVGIFQPGAGMDIRAFEPDMARFSGHTTTVQDFLPMLAHGIFISPWKAVVQGNVLALIVLAIGAGIGINMLGQRAASLSRGINVLFHGIMTVVNWVMWLAPLGVLGLLAKLTAQQNAGLIGILFKYVAVVFGATMVHGCITLPLILWAITGRRPLAFLRGMRDAFVTAFSTSSSSATLPVSLRCVTQNLNVDRATAGFVMPMGAALNMDGTALYEAVAAIFVANLCGIHLGIGQQVVVALTAMLASVGAPGIPSAGMVTMILVLQSVGLPIEAVAILIPIDRPLDTFRTVVNVEGDAVGACVVDHMARHA